MTVYITVPPTRSNPFWLTPTSTVPIGSAGATQRTSSDETKVAETRWMTSEQAPIRAQLAQLEQNLAEADGMREIGRAHV